AEDGIRDFHVTGVQTCALPILSDIQSLLAAAELPDSPSPRLDAELLLAHVLGRPRSFLRTWPEHVPSAEQCAAFAELLARRRAEVGRASCREVVEAHVGRWLCQ